ncbi:LysR family transcriptional regulator [Pseudomonas sp. F3-2]|uniref:LysR family transcriptional regulator n=1 Tax=Pseudomonas sp. F3-2 TaxID=3141539 RepID=UPI00315D07E6
MAAFAVVVETGSFIDASLKLGVTASAVSKQISRLENALSIRLLERSTRQLKVNAEGAEIYSHCRELLDSSANVFRLKDRFLEKPQGLIRLVVPKAFHRACNTTLPEFLRKYPDINIQLISSDRSLDFIADSVDIGITVTDKPPLGLVARKLFHVDYVFARL